MTATDKAAEVVADVAEEVADNALFVADAAHGAAGRGFGLGVSVAAFLVGAGVGGGVAFVLAKRQLETKYSSLAEEEIAEMRAHYAAKSRALDAENAKRPIKEIVAERGYASPDTSRPPMAVQPPAAVVEEVGEAAEPDDSAMAEDDVEGPTGVKDLPPEPEVVRNIFRERDKEQKRRRQALPEWNWHEERTKRSPDKPYVIHTDERHEMEGYSDISLTYYSGDDVICDERDDVMDPARRDSLLGEKNLERFGHGSGDPEIVYIRNDSLEIVYEVVLSPNTYAEEVHGFNHHDGYHGNLERMRRSERHGQED